jgi:hypothetical protein
MQRAKRLASSSKVFPASSKESLIKSESINTMQIKNRASDLSCKGQQMSCFENISAVDKSQGNIEDELLKISMVDLESMNGDQTPNSSANVVDLSYNDISLLSVSNNSQKSPAYPIVPRIQNFEDSNP